MNWRRIVNLNLRISYIPVSRISYTLIIHCADQYSTLAFFTMGNGGRIGSNINTVTIFHKFAERFFLTLSAFNIEMNMGSTSAGNLGSFLFIGRKGQG